MTGLCLLVSHGLFFTDYNCEMLDISLLNLSLKQHIHILCSITEQLHLRIADSALSEDLFPEDYQALASANPGDITVRPVAWMSLEAITEGVTSQPSDVVS